MIYITSDHRGFNVKKALVQYLLKQNYEFIDLGPHKLNKQDSFVDYSHLLTKSIKTVNDFGIILCGSGVGVSIACNRAKHIRAGLCTSEKQIIAARQEDDINVLCLPAEYISNAKAYQFVNSFLKTNFKNIKRYKERIKQIS